MRLTIILISFLFCYSIYGQDGTWTDWMRLYSDEEVKVDVQFKVHNSCGEFSKLSKYQYQVRGKLKSYPYFVNWKMDYIDCTGNLYYEGLSISIGQGGSLRVVKSMDYQFQCQDIDQYFYDIDASRIQKLKKGIKSTPSVAAKEISGRTSILKGTSSTLSVVGGTLGRHASWVWYRDECGGKQIGKGVSITVTPDQSTTYFVRAESEFHQTECIHLYVIISNLSLAATHIATNAESPCIGETVTLSAEGGGLGLGANWMWYKDDCDGEPIGEGVSIEVIADGSAIYYVRAEGLNNITACSQIAVNAFKKSHQPEDIVGPGTVCEGTDVLLKVIGGQLEESSTWAWHSGSCGEEIIGFGDSITVNPLVTGDYFVRSHGGCNVTSCVTKKINVLPKSYLPMAVIVPDTIYNGEKIQFTVGDGRLGHEAKWLWFKETCSSAQQIGEGDSITIKAKDGTIYYLRAEGLCNITSCREISIKAYKRHEYHPIYTDYGNGKKFMHLGFGIGGELNSFTPLMQRESITDTGTVVASEPHGYAVTGLGIRGDIVYHPYIKNNVSIGFLGSFVVGGLPPSNTGRTSQSYFYHRFLIGIDIAVGLNGMKLLAGYKLMTTYHSFDAKTTFPNGIDHHYLQGDIKTERLSGGFRFGNYRRKDNSRGASVDLLLNLTKDVSWKASNWSTKLYNDFSGWRLGTELAIWVHSVLKIETNLILKTTLGQSNGIANLSFRQPAFYFSVLYSGDLFY